MKNNRKRPLATFSLSQRVLRRLEKAYAKGYNKSKLVEISLEEYLKELEKKKLI